MSYADRILKKVKNGHRNDKNKENFMKILYELRDLHSKGQSIIKVEVKTDTPLDFKATLPDGQAFTSGASLLKYLFDNPLLQPQALKDWIEEVKEEQEEAAPLAAAPDPAAAAATPRPAAASGDRHAPDGPAAAAAAGEAPTAAKTRRGRPANANKNAAAAAAGEAPAKKRGGNKTAAAAAAGEAPPAKKNRRVKKNPADDLLSDANNTPRGSDHDVPDLANRTSSVEDVVQARDNRKARQDPPVKREDQRQTGLGGAGGAGPVAGGAAAAAAAGGSNHCSHCKAALSECFVSVKCPGCKELVHFTDECAAGCPKLTQPGMDEACAHCGVSLGVLSKGLCGGCDSTVHMRDNNTPCRPCKCAKPS